MALLSTAEIRKQAERILLNRTFQCLLLNNNGVAFDASASYASIAAKEVALGDGGYSRLEFTYTSTDIEDIVAGIVTKTKRAVFIHDGSVNPIVYDHFAIVEKTVVNSVTSYSVVAVQPLGVTARLSTGGEEAQFVINGRHKNL